MKTSFSCMLCLAILIPSYAQKITFETVPGDIPREGLVINRQYQESHGVTFIFEDGTYAILAEVGGEAKGFYGPPNSENPDQPAPGQDVGRFFLTKGFQVGMTPPPLLINYDYAVSQVSGQLLDIDNGESITVQARDRNGNVLEQVVIRAGAPGTGDGVASEFYFSRDSRDIMSLRIIANRGESGSTGIAFDNFSPSEEPPPRVSNICGPPGLSGHHSWINLSRAQCMDRARNAILAAGFSVAGEADGYVIGRSQVMSAFIRCICTIDGIQPNEETLMAVTTASPKNWKPGPEPVRNFMISYMRNPATAGTPPAVNYPPGSNGPETVGPGSGGPGNGGGPGGGGSGINYQQHICDNPETINAMDEWLAQAIPPQDEDETLIYDPWGRIIGVSTNSFLIAENPPTTTLSRCEWLYRMAADLQSTNMGTLMEYLNQTLKRR